MDTNYNETSKIVSEKISGVKRLTFHAPFNELCPAAIDPLVKEIAYKRYYQAFDLAKQYNIKKIIIHSGYVPLVYYKSYFIEESVKFYKNLLKNIDDDMIICLENVMEDEPNMLLDIVKQVNDKRFGLCIDIGHLNCQSNGYKLSDWLNISKDYIYHYHIHNNDGYKDTHNSLDNGTVDFIEFFKLADTLTKNATCTIESIDALSSIKYMIDNNIIED